MSALEQQLELHLRALGLEYEREYRFAPPRRWRFDFAFPDSMVAVECEGLTRYGSNRDGSMRLGRHQTAKGAKSDAEKYNAAAEAGWRVFRYTAEHIKSGEAAAQIERVLS